MKTTTSNGRIYIHSERTGKTYCCEPLLKSIRSGCFKSIEQNPGGGVHPKDTVIKEKNGFRNIETLRPGESPMEWVERIDAQYPDKRS